MPVLNCTIPRSVEVSLANRVKATGQSISSIVSDALAECLDVPVHSLFQVSTSGALVKGVYQNAVSAGTLKEHGDFGLGTFENLDGEMVVLDGHVYHVKDDGTVSEVPDNTGAPFAVVTRFEAGETGQISNVGSIQEITAHCDRHRNSLNLFYAFRIEGYFEMVHARAMRATTKPLAQAAATQPEFNFNDLNGTLVGIWSPQFSAAFSVPGYHFHFLSADRSKGGHLLDCSGSNLQIQVETLTDFHVSLPETEEFLKADFSGNTSADLAYAEQLHK
jgi:acetolactate decarboxylase